MKRGAKLTEVNGKSREVHYAAIEFASEGELFDWVCETGKFSEPVARYYFK